MIYEIRVYRAAEGREEALRSRFLTEVLPRLSKHGVEVVGVFTPNPLDGRLIYITRFPDEPARQSGWSAFSSDEDWLSAKRKSEQDGPLLAEQTVSVLSPAARGLLLG